MALDPGMGTRATPTSTRRTDPALFRRDDEQEMVTQRLRDIDQQEAERFSSAVQDPRVAAMRFDPLTAVSDSISRVGINRFNRRVNDLSDSWRKYFNTDPDPALTLDLARSGVEGSIWRDVYRDIATQSGAMRGTADRSDAQQRQNWLERGVMWAGETVGIWQGEQEAEMRRLAAGEDGWLRKGAYDQAYGELNQIGQPNPLLVPQKGETLMFIDPAWDIWREYKTGRAEEAVRAYWEDRILHAPDIGSTWSDAPLERSRAQNLAYPAWILLTGGGVKTAEILARANSSMERGEAESYALAALSAWDRSTMEGVYRFAQTAGMLGGLGKKLAAKTVGEPVVAMVGYGMVNSPQFAALVEAAAPAARITADVMGKVWETVVPKPVRDPLWTLQQIDKAKDAAGWTFYYMLRYSTYNQDMFQTMHPGSGALMPRGTPADNPEEWRRFHEAQGKNILEFAVSEAGKEVAQSHPLMSTALGYAGVDVAKYPTLTLMADIAFYAMGDFAIGGGMRSGWRAINGKALTQEGLKRIPYTREISERIADETSPSKIAAVTNIWRPEVLNQLAEAGTKDQVTELLTRYIADHGGRIEPGQVMLRRQLYGMAMTSDKWDLMPKVARRFFKVFPDTTPGLHVADGQSTAAALGMGDAFLMPTAWKFKVADELLEAQTNQARIGIMSRAWKEAAAKDPKKYEKVLEHVKAQRKARRAEEVSGKAFAIDVETGKEISVRTKSAHFDELTKKQLSHETELDNVRAQDELIVEIRGTLSSAEEERLTMALDQAGEWLKKQQGHIDDITAKIDDLEVTPEKIAAAADDFYRDSMGFVDPIEKAARDFILQRQGGLKYGSDLDKKLSMTEKQARLGHMWRADGSPIDTAAQELNGMFPALGIENGDDLVEWLSRGKKRAETPDEFIGYAERYLASVKVDGGYDSLMRQLTDAQTELQQMTDVVKSGGTRMDDHLAALQRARSAARMPAPQPTTGENLLDFRRVPARQKQLEDELEGIKHELAKLADEPDEVVVPLMPYQFGQYFYPEVPLETVSSFYTGPVSRTLERANSVQLPGPIGVSTDKLVSMWKRFALGSAGIMARVAMDEPLRMLSAGYGADAILAMTGKAPSRTAYLSEAAGQLGYMAATDQDAFTMMRYLLDNVHPTAHVVMAPGSAGYVSSLRHTLKVTRDQVTTQRWLAEGRKGILDWVTTTTPGRAALKSRGGSLDEFVDQMDEFLTKFTHRRVNHDQYNTGVLSADEVAEWERYAAAGEDAVAPAWFNPTIDKVITESSTGKMLHMRQDAQFMGMLEGRIPMTKNMIESIPFHKLPYISARRPRGAIVNGEGIMETARSTRWPLVDDVFDFFDAGMRNVRDTIFAREYIGERNNLERLMKESGREINGDEIHTLAAKYARDKVDEMTYNTQRSGLESTLRNVVPFAPATRDFITWWGKEFARRPSRAAMYARLQEMPDKAEQYIPEELAGAIGMTMKGLAPAIIAAGGLAAYMKKDPMLFVKSVGAAAAAGGIGMGVEAMGGETASFNPRTLTFFTGGAGDSSAGGNMGLQMIEQNLPGFAPTITMPAGWLASTFPERFGPYPFMWGDWNVDISKVPGLELINKEIPLSSRTERFIYGMSAVISGVLSSDPETFIETGKFSGNFTGLDIGKVAGFFGRNMEARKRAVDLELQYIAAQGDFDLSTEEGRKAALAEAKKQTGKREFWTGLLGWMLPAIPYFRDAEASDVRSALSTYRETYMMGDDPTDSPQHAAAKSWAEGQRKRAAMREEMPEYAAIFDYTDGLEMGDVEKTAMVGQEHPEVVSYFVSLYDNNGLEAEDLDVNDVAPNSMEAWIAERVMGQHPVKEPDNYAFLLGKQQARKKEYEYTKGRWSQFYRTMEDMGYKEGDAEYIDAKTKTNEDIALHTDSAAPGSPYFRVDSRPPVLDALDKSAGRVSWEERATAAIVAEYQEVKLEAVNDHDKAFMKQQFREQLIGMGLDPNSLDTRQEPRTAAERTQRELMDFINSDPFGWSQEEATRHNITFTSSTREYMAKALEAVTEVKEWLSTNDAGFYDAKSESIRTAYFGYINKLGQGDPGFAGAWDYIQKPKWERLRDTGSATSESWDKWFDALAQRDEWLARQTKVSVFKMTPDGSKATAPLRDALWTYASKLKSDDPDFASEFDKYAQSFWNTERTW